MEGQKGATEKFGADEVILQILAGDDEENKEAKESKRSASIDNGGNSYSLNQTPQGESLQQKTSKSDSSLPDSGLRCTIPMPSVASPQSDISKMSPSPNKPPKIPTQSISRRRSFSQSSFSKSKSRLVEPPCPADVNLEEEKAQTNVTSGLPQLSTPIAAPLASKDGAPTPIPKSVPVTPRTPVIITPEEDEEEDEEVYKTADLKVKQMSSKKMKKMVVIEWILFVCITGLLIASLTVERLENEHIWGLELWKWAVLVMVIFCGRLFSQWFIHCLVFLLERNFLLQRKVLYFVFGMRKSVIVFIWLALVLLAWVLLFIRRNDRTEKTNEILHYVTRVLASTLVGAAIWLLKTLSVKLVSSSYQCTRFFDRIQDSIFHQYVLRTLSGPPLMENAEKLGRTNTATLSFRHLKKLKDNVKEGTEEVIDVQKLKNLKQGKVSAWTMKGLMNVIGSSGLSTISNTLEADADEEDGDTKKDKGINNEWEAKAAAYQIFRNVAKPDSKYIEEEDLLRFLKKEEVDTILPQFEGAADTRRIKRKSLKNWLVNVYLERKALALSLTDTKTAIEELNRLLSVLIVIVIIVVWLLVMGFLTTHILLLLSSQLLLVVFVFGNSAKAVFEAIIFVFVMHPFDVGDRCVVDGVQMIVEEMNLLTTIFLRYDNEKISYPNSVLAIKPISNFYRSPEMSDSIEFGIDLSTSLETVGALKERIKSYLESKPQHWRPNHSVIVKEIEDVNKMKLGLYVNHTINFQNYGDKSSRRSDLVLQLKKIFEELGIKYHLLPQEVRLGHVDSGNSAVPPGWR